jgi:hypothetical protein
MLMLKSWKFAALAAGLALASACKTQGQEGTNTATTGETAEDEAVSGGTDTVEPGTGGTDTGTTGGGTSIPALVNVNLENVLNDLSVQISVDRANIPVNAQVPIEVAANVCGVSVTALAASIASGQAGCTATTTSPELIQVVQQQVAAGGDVGGGDQTTTSPTNNFM